ncbi:YusU family protein [Salsuginibacillus kocurii]|uniref:YusU family protein n=1 Tax=Salsuginibacillus kocurii TaxID=427078 RepID=UPI00037011BE|nr:YusU family protein [Salsuginibacillus kocurii]
MDNQLQEQLDGLLEKYTELLLGEATPERKEEVKAWIVYTHISKQMPPLARHWNETYPAGKEGIKEVIQHIQALNAEEKQKQNEKKEGDS